MGKASLPLLAAICSWYDMHLTNAPLRTRMATASLLGACGDAVAQRAEAGAHDWERTARRALWFGTGSAIPGHFWYTNIERIVRASGLQGLIQKIVLEEILYTPPLHAAFFFTDAKMQGFSNAVAMATVREKFWPALLAGWIFWPAMDIVTFSGLVPVRYRMLWVGLCQIGWSAYVSALAAQPSEAPKAIGGGQGPHAKVPQRPHTMLAARATVGAASGPMQEVRDVRRSDDAALVGASAPAVSVCTGGGRHDKRG